MNADLNGGVDNPTTIVNFSHCVFVLTCNGYNI